MELPINCLSGNLYVDNKIADIIFKFIDNSIDDGKQKESRLQLYN